MRRARVVVRRRLASFSEPFGQFSGVSRPSSSAQSVCTIEMSFTGVIVCHLLRRIASTAVVAYELKSASITAVAFWSMCAALLRPKFSIHVCTYGCQPMSLSLR